MLLASRRFVSTIFKQSIRLASAAVASEQPGTASASNVGIPLENGPSVSLPSSGEDRKLSAQVESIVEQIVNLPLLEVSDLNYALKKRLNIPDMPLMTAATAFAQPAAAAAGGEPAETASADASAQKISFAVKLTKFDESKKIALIKQIRDLIPGLNLVQAKKFVEGVPTEVKNDLGKKEAEELKATLEKCGGVVEIV